MDLDEQLKALSHPFRRQVLQWLKQPEQWFAEQQHPLSFGVCAGQIEQRSVLSQSTVSAHLATLQRAGFIQSRKVGQWIFYRRDEQALQQFFLSFQHQL